MPTHDCFVCNKHTTLRDDLLVHSDDIGVVSHKDGKDVYVGYLFVEPRRHLGGLGDTTDQEAQHLALLISRAANALRRTGCEHVYSFVLGDEVPHLHVHVIGRHPGAPRAFWGTAVDDWPEAPHVSRAELGRVTAGLRAAFEPV